MGGRVQDAARGKPTADRSTVRGQTRPERRHRMTATAPRQESARPHAEQEAWDQYRDDLRELEGREYEDAEDASWDRLQHRLREIADDNED
jgi:hypothetical protein